MPNLTLYSKVLRGIWLIEPEAATGMMPLVYSFVTRSTIEADEKESEETLPFAISGALHEVKRWNSYNEAPPGSTAVITLKGAVEKDDYCGTPGTATLAKRVKQANDHNNIKGIILKVDSPGGHVDGTQLLANTIRATTKPVIALVDGMMASAAYWIGSAADEVVIMNDTALVGSIGTMVTMADIKSFYEKEGLKIHEVYATKSTEKNAIFQKVMEGDYKPLQQNLLDPTNEIFLTAVKQNRAGKMDLSQENVLSGQIYMAADAIRYGLADHMGDMSFAVERIDSLSPDTNLNSNTSMPIDMKKYARTAKVTDLAEAESTEDGVHFQEQHLQAVETALEAGETSASRVTELEGLLSAETTAKETALQERDAARAALQKGPGTPPGAASNAEDSQEDEESENDNPFYCEADAEMDVLLKQIEG